MSASNRRRGHTWERDVANYLDSRIEDVEVQTTRNLFGPYYKGADLGSVDGGDRCEHVLGWTLECKYRQESSRGAWIRQAKAASDGSGLFAVVVKTPRRPTGEGMVWAPRNVWRRWFDLEPGESEEVEGMTLSAFATVLS